MGFVTCPGCGGQRTAPGVTGSIPCPTCDGAGQIHTSRIAAPRRDLTNPEPIDWNQSFEPGAIKIDAFSADQHRRSAEHDAKVFGLGFLVDGKHVDPSRVTVIERRQLTESTNELGDAI